MGKDRSAYVFQYMLDNPDIAPQINNAVYTDKYIDGIRAKWIAEEIIRRMEGKEQISMLEFYNNLPEPKPSYCYMCNILDYNCKQHTRVSTKYSKSFNELVKKRRGSRKYMKIQMNTMQQDLGILADRCRPDYHHRVYPLLKRYCRQFFSRFKLPSATKDGLYHVELKAHQAKREEGYNNYIINVQFSTFGDMALFLFGYAMGYKMGMLRESKKWETIALKEYQKRKEEELL